MGRPEPKISVSLPDGSMTPPAPLSLVKQALDEVKGKRTRTPMKETPADKTVADHAYGIAADELRQFIERFEQLESEKKDVAEQQKELMAEAKGRGYDTKAMRKIVALRKQNPEDVAEDEAVLEMYKTALGMA